MEVNADESSKTDSTIEVNKDESNKTGNTMEVNDEESSKGSTPIVEKIGKLEKLLIDGKATFVDDEGHPIPSTSATKRVNPFSKVGEIMESDSEDELVSNPFDESANLFGGGQEFDQDYDDYDDYANQVYDLPGNLDAFNAIYGTKLQGPRKITPLYPKKNSLRAQGDNYWKPASETGLHNHLQDTPQCCNLKSHIEETEEDQTRSKPSWYIIIVYRSRVRNNLSVPVFTL
ncbi:hypothetical protein CTI12_AA043360 [Artemisia annua]|uniref:Uncharacterized protein n=1 Tax=Artemisia annua TaxID=35608 RepID=A0A2U1QDE6_ARTAN|nr:hypothetical protein CTI12_AA043360 [Artemisia annua]